MLERTADLVVPGHAEGAGAQAGHLLAQPIRPLHLRPKVCLHAHSVHCHMLRATLPFPQSQQIHPAALNASLSFRLKCPAVLARNS